MRNKINNTEIANFMFAGKSILTIVNKETSNRFTYKLRMAKSTNGEQNPPYFVSVLTGNDNNNDYSFIGTVFGKNSYRHSGKSRISNNTTSVMAFNWLLNRIANGQDLPSQIEVWHEGKCGRCGRKLTVPSSIQSGLGPECARR
jgi:hypothetical protein